MKKSKRTAKASRGPRKTTTRTSQADALGYITPALRPLAVVIDSLTSDPRNARLHDQRNLDSIRFSLQKFGQQRPISIDADGVVLAGNGTLAAARALGWTHIAAVRSHLRGLEARAYAIADNRTAELATWDAQELAAQLAELDDAGLGFGAEDLAFTNEDLDALLAGTESEDEEKNFEPEAGAAQPRLDQRRAVKCPGCGTTFVPGEGGPEEE